MPFWRRKPRRGRPRRRRETIEPGPDGRPGWEPDPPTSRTRADRRPGRRPSRGEPAAATGRSTPRPAESSPRAGTPPVPDSRRPTPAAGPAAPSPAAPPRPSPTRRPSPSRARRAALDAGLERTRGGFMSRLRGLLGGGPRARPGTTSRRRSSPATSARPSRSTSSSAPARRRDPAGAEAAVRAELAALLVPRDLGLGPRPAVAGRPGRHPRRRRQRHRQDHDDRQARQPLRGPRADRVILAAADTFRAAAIDQLRHLGRPGRRRRWSPTPRAPTRARSSTTRSTRPSRAAPTSSSPTRPAACTRSRT